MVIEIGKEIILKNLKKDKLRDKGGKRGIRIMGGSNLFK